MIVDSLTFDITTFRKFRKTSNKTCYMMLKTKIVWESLLFVCAIFEAWSWKLHGVESGVIHQRIFLLFFANILFLTWKRLNRIEVKPIYRLGFLILIFYLLFPLINSEIIINHYRKRKVMVLITKVVKQQYNSVSLAETLIWKIYLFIQTGFFLIIGKIKSMVISHIFKNNPLTLHKRIIQLLNYLSWVRYLAPFIPVCNRMRFHISDIINKRRQQQKSETARRNWSNVLRSITKKQKIEMWVLRMQANFRKKHESRALDAIKNIQEKRSRMMSVTVHEKMAALMNVAKARRARQNTEATFQSKMQTQVSSQEDREHFWRIKKQLKEMRYRSNKLLLRPSTKFVLTWKIVAILSMLLEVLQLLASRHFFPKTMEIMPLEQSIIAIVPQEIAPCIVGNSDVSNKSKAFSTNLKFLRRIARLRTPDTNICLPITSNAWTTIAFMASIYLSRILVLLIRFISASDVFINFFTGEIDEVTGTIKPKSFFRRWIIPGLLLQLLINPSIEMLFHFIRKVIHFSFVEIGLTRMFYMFTATNCVIRVVVSHLHTFFLRFVAYQNKLVFTSVWR